MQLLDLSSTREVRYNAARERHAGSLQRFEEERQSEEERREQSLAEERRKQEQIQEFRAEKERRHQEEQDFTTIKVDPEAGRYKKSAQVLAKGAQWFGRNTMLRGTEQSLQDYGQSKVDKVLLEAQEQANKQFMKARDMHKAGKLSDEAYQKIIKITREQSEDISSKIGGELVMKSDKELQGQGFQTAVEIGTLGLGSLLKAGAGKAMPIVGQKIATKATAKALAKRELAKTIVERELAAGATKEVAKKVAQKEVAKATSKQALKEGMGVGAMIGAAEMGAEEYKKEEATKGDIAKQAALGGIIGATIPVIGRKAVGLGALAGAGITAITDEEATLGDIGKGAGAGAGAVFSAQKASKYFTKSLSGIAERVMNRKKVLQNGKEMSKIIGQPKDIEDFIATRPNLNMQRLDKVPGEPGTKSSFQWDSKTQKATILLTKDADDGIIMSHIGDYVNKVYPELSEFGDEIKKITGKEDDIASAFTRIISGDKDAIIQAPNLAREIENLVKVKIPDVDIPVSKTVDGMPEELLAEDIDKIAEEVAGEIVPIKGYVPPKKVKAEVSPEKAPEAVVEPKAKTTEAKETVEGKPITKEEIKIAEIKKTKVSKMAQSIEQKMKDSRLLDVDETIKKSHYDVKTVKGEAEKVSKIISDEKKLSQILSGEKALPEDVSGMMFVTGVEDMIKKMTDTKKAFKMSEQLASERFAGQSSKHAQEMRFMAERDPDSVTVSMKKIKDARKKVAGTKIEKEKKEIKKHIKKAQDNQTWDDFVDTITC